MTARTAADDQALPDPAGPSRRGRAAWTAIGRAHGRHRVFLIAACAALVLAAVGDEAPGYDGPGPFVDLALAVAAALAWWRFTAPLVVAVSAFFVVGGLATPAFAARLVHPGHAVDFAAGWLQMLGFTAAALFAAGAAVHARRISR